uniref:Uncharacterized protein n=1 Tax=Rhizophora mucronata TaxID=61149 RepID=A0A2P2KW71_RHIMU
MSISLTNCTLTQISREMG